MSEEELKKLIEKYYDGESTEDEEKALRDYFRQDYIPEGYETEKDIFGYYTASGEVPGPSPVFEERILAGIEATERERRLQNRKKYLIPLLSAAAGLLILSGSYFFFIHRAEPVDTFSDPEIAYAETMKILIEVSSQLNHGTQALEPVSKISKITTTSFKSVNRSAKIIEKSLKELDHLQKAAVITNISTDKKKNK